MHQAASYFESNTAQNIREKVVSKYFKKIHMVSIKQLLTVSTGMENPTPDEVPEGE